MHDMQAARGTSVAAPTGAPRRARLLFAAVALVLYAIDQGTKALAVENLSGRATNVELIGTVLQLQLVRNPGAAFSTGTGFTPVLTVIAIVAALVVLWFSRRLVSLGWAAALGLLLAGIVGNLTDRLAREPGPFHGHVVDFLRLPNWPIFNVADISINLAAALILVLAFRGVGLDGRRDSDEADEADDSDDSDEVDQPDQAARAGDDPAASPAVRDSGDTTT